MPLLALLLLPLLARGAVPAEHPCSPVQGIGCFYAPDTGSRTLPLLVYLRGHHPEFGAEVPASRALDSARQAFDFYGLAESARSAGYAVLVTYKSAVSVGERDVQALASARGLTFPARVAAAHSGGYVGLLSVLNGDLSLQRVILLDCFYSGSPALAEKVQAAFGNGACRGYLTPHGFPRRNGTAYSNETNFQANFRPFAPGCRVEKLGDGDHNPGVKRCLGAYLEGRPCL